MRLKILFLFSAKQLTSHVTVTLLVEIIIPAWANFYRFYQYQVTMNTKVLWQHVSIADKKICHTKLNWTPKFEEETERGKCSENCDRGQILERAMNFGSQKWTTYFGNSFRSSDENYYQVFQKYSWKLLSCRTMWLSFTKDTFSNI